MDIMDTMDDMNTMDNINNIYSSSTWATYMYMVATSFCDGRRWETDCVCDVALRIVLSELILQYRKLNYL